MKEGVTTLVSTLEALRKEVEKEMVSPEKVTALSQAVQALFPLTLN